MLYHVSGNVVQPDKPLVFGIEAEGVEFMLLLKDGLTPAGIVSELYLPGHKRAELADSHIGNHRRNPIIFHSAPYFHELSLVG